MSFRRSIAALGIVGAFALLGAPEAPAEHRTNHRVTPWFSSTAGAYLAGRAAFRAGDPVLSAEFMGRALRGDPNNTSLILQAFRLTIEAGDIRAAIPLANRVQEQAPTDPLVILVQAAGAAEKGHFTTALEHAETWLDADQRALMPAFIAAWSHAALGDGDAAIAALERVDRGEATDWMGVERGLIREYLGDTEQARAGFERSLASASDRRIVQSAGRFFEQQGEVDRARSLYDAYLADTPLDPVIRAERDRLEAGIQPEPMVQSPAQAIGQVMIQLAANVAGDQSQSHLPAQIYVHLGLHLDPANDQGKLVLGSLLHDAGRDTEAERILASLPDDAPLAWHAGLERAQALHGLGRLDEALAVLDRLAEARPDAAEPLILKGNFLRIVDRLEAAAEAYNQAFAADPDRIGTDWYLHFLRAVVLTSLDRWNQAEEDLQEAVRISPDNAQVLNYLGYMWVDRGINVLEAGEMIRQAVELQPDDGNIIDSLGWYYFRIGDFGDAVVHLEDAVAREPDNAVINDHLGDAYWMVGRHTEARFQWNRALRTADEEPVPGLRAAIEEKLDRGLIDPLVVDLAGTPSNPSEQ